MKKFITMIMVVTMIITTLALPAGAVCESKRARPDIIGMEHYETVKDIHDLYEEEGIEIDYFIEMIRVEGYWIVELEGSAYEYREYTAYGIYDHIPSEDEIDILWANRMTDDEYDILSEKYGF